MVLSWGATEGRMDWKGGICNGNRTCSGARCDGQWSRV